MEHYRTLIRLLSIQGIGPQKIRALAGKFSNLDDVFHASIHDLLQIPGIDTTLAHRILENTQSEIIADKQLEMAHKHHVTLVSYFDQHYPQLLKSIYDPPILLFIKGSLSTLSDSAISIVGTRHPTSYGQLVTDQFTEGLVRANFCIVSGLARGIDTIAHRTALKYNGKTAAVIGSGIDIPYPPENKKLLQQIAENGIVISEFLLGTAPDAPNFPRRNRIISGLTVATIVIESDIDGGAMITANFANDQNRDVFAVPGSVFEKKSNGPNFLIKENKAKLVTSVKDILQELQTQLQLPLDKDETPLPQLSERESIIYNILDSIPQHIDIIADKSALPTSDVLVTLLELEFKNLVRQLPGKFFIRI